MALSGSWVTQVQAAPPWPARLSRARPPRPALRALGRRPSSPSPRGCPDQLLFLARLEAARTSGPACTSSPTPPATPSGLYSDLTFSETHSSPRSDPWPEKIPHAMGQLSPWATREATAERSPRTAAREQPLLVTIRGSPRQQ